MRDETKEPDVIYEKIANSQTFGQFKDAFEAATGMTLSIRQVDSDGQSVASVKKSTEFCRQVHEHSRCPDCVHAAHCLSNDEPVGPKSTTCFAGLSGSSVPVMAGQVPVAWIFTGKVVAGERDEDAFEKVKSSLRKMDCPSATLKNLEKSWREIKEVSEEQYRGMLGLLSIFAAQLSEMCERFLLIQREAEPAAVVKARQYVSANLSDPIGLDEVAKHVNISPYHFCKVFKEATGFTFKQYVTRRRVEWAKCRLRKADVRVTEVAYEVGFGSLSQFNRSFQQLTGVSPSAWRQKELKTLV